MSLLNWRNFSRRPDIQHLPLQEQLYLFEQENKRKTEQNWFLEAQLTAGGAGGGFAGNASDGPIAGATVTTDVGTTTTDTLGNFTFTQTPTSEITVTGGTDSITGVAFTGELKGFPQYKTVSPLTTLAFHLKEEDTSLTADTAVDLLFASSSTLFGVELEVADKDIMLNKDYVAESVLGDNQKAIAAQSIATYLESVTEMVGSAVKSADESEKGSNFTTNSAKVQGYKSIARQIQGTRGAKTEIDPEGLFDLVRRPDGQSFTRGNTGSLDVTARRAVKTSINNVRTQLAELSRSELYNANYLTTQIQAVNRGVKEDYKVQAERLARGDSSNFKSMREVITESTASLARIEKDKPNETDANTSKKPSREFFQLGGMTYTMQEKGSKAVTLSFKSDPGQMFVVGTEIRKGQFLNNESGPFRPNEASNFVKAAPTIIATQVTASAGKVFEITLANPGFQVLSSELKTAVKYLPVASGGYTIQNESKGKWANAPIHPFTASIAANQTASRAVLNSRGASTLYEIEYNSATSRYEFSSTPSKGTKTLHAHIADFTNEAEWTNADPKLSSKTRFLINNNNSHILATGTYQITKTGGLAISLNMSNLPNLGGGRVLSATYSKIPFQIHPTSAAGAPFTVKVTGSEAQTISTSAQFVNNVLTFEYEGNNYTVTYKS